MAIQMQVTALARATVSFPAFVRATLSRENGGGANVEWTLTLYAEHVNNQDLAAVTLRQAVLDLIDALHAAVTTDG